MHRNISKVENCFLPWLSDSPLKLKILTKKMLVTTSLQTYLKPPFKTLTSFPSQNPTLFLLKPLTVSPKTSNFAKPIISPQVKAKAQVLSDELPLDDSPSESSSYKEKLGVVVKPLEKPRVVLKFIWMEKDIGIALDQVIPGHGTIPLSPYYFWPRKDAWEELKVLLENKPWISHMQRIHLLNQATDIINLWQTSGGKPMSIIFELRIII
ncbi:PREDICTED: 30S ribosomal protein 3, chloroplastic isoform X1 [Theobroma cacao]|uniref:30S ribosomal protein 3, chloroplastic isoform X1 n=1 Tax=Theobroma cacao TaxID=3641 RepID=A0AB32W6B1_THECC|nr:PREDICTED: 30S ribosomal protein 3, chloroplastic isoform X1 [Theobroma cacao]